MSTSIAILANGYLEIVCLDPWLPLLYRHLRCETDCRLQVRLSSIDLARHPLMKAVRQIFQKPDYVR
jgi:hypothetical protein